MRLGRRGRRGAPPSPATATPDERTVRIARKRFARRQWARRWRVWRRLLAALLVIGAVAGAVWLVWFSSVLAVTGVRVEGADVLDPAQVRRVAQVPVGEPLARAPLDAIEARVETLAPVARVEASRSWPDHVRIDVTEREAVAVVLRDGSYRGLDAEGVLFRDYPRRPAGLPVIEISARTRADALAEAAQVVDALPSRLAREVAHLEVRTVDSISLQLRDGRTVFWGSAAASDTKADVLAVLLEQKARVYDVSVPGQPTLRR